MDEKKRARFLMVYQNLPLNERKNTIVIIDDKKKKLNKEPISWDIAYIEVCNNTELGEKILNKLIELNLI